MQNDRRRHSRAPIRLSIRFATPKAFVQQYGKNISKGGLFIATDHPAAVRSEIDITLHLPMTEVAIEVRAKVVYVSTGLDGKPGGMGVQFVNLSEERSSLIEKYVAAVMQSAMKNAKTRP